MPRDSTRVLLLADMPPPVHGVTVVTARVHNILKDRGMQIAVKSPHGAVDMADVGRRKVRKGLEFLWFLIRLLFSGEKADVVYLTLAPAPPTCWRDGLLAFVAKRLAPRCIMHVHGEELEDLLRRPLLRFLVRGVELIAITSRTVSEARAAGIFKAVWHLPNCVDDSRASPKAADKVRLLYLANVQPAKGVHTFLEILAHLKLHSVPFTADLVGDGTPYLTVEQVKTQAMNMGLAKCVHIHGPLYGKRKQKILAQADVLVYPSRHDHAPLVVLEALCAGAVPVVLDVGGVREIVGSDFRKNVISPKFSTHKVVEKMLEIIRGYIDNPESLLQDKKAARGRYEAAFMPDLFARRLASIFAGELFEE